ncbi:MAG TPA: hypothetical protein VGL27_02480 [Negativicutes bacterium]|jgi:hypothetical protein
MNNFECKKVENCFGGMVAFEYRLSFKIGEPFLDCLRPVAQVQCRHDFPRPFFQAVWPDGLKVKGVLGDVVVKAIYPPANTDGSKVMFENLLGQCIEQINGD